MRARSWVLACFALVGCQNLQAPPYPELARDGGAADVALSFRPAADASDVPQVVRIRILLPSGASEDSTDTWLFDGQLSKYYLDRIRRDDLPHTLLARQAPALVWAEPASGELVIAPSVPLTPGDTYSLASTELGLIATFSVHKGSGAPLLTRVWPPAEAGSGAGCAVFCRDASAPRVAGRAELEPVGVSARVVPGANDAGALRGSCLALFAQGPLPDGAALVPPPRYGRAALDPAPLSAGLAPDGGAEPACDADETRFATGCALVLDDRLVVRPPAAPAFWVVTHDDIAMRHTVASGERFVVRGLHPASEESLYASVTDLSGREHDFRMTVRTAPILPHVVINEVMANPLGPEPAQEWVELVNDGGAAVELQGYRLSDGAGSSELGAARLEPGAFALIVRDDFVADDGEDVKPASGTTLIRVPEIGKNGLSNAGELLTLSDADGNVVSRFPALSASKGGVSMARRHPWSLDDDARAFGPSADGASPGAPNQL
jgi:Lamin Tail Domain